MQKFISYYCLFLHHSSTPVAYFMIKISNVLSSAVSAITTNFVAPLLSSSDSGCSNKKSGQKLLRNQLHRS
ncbi:unnamed protein product [Heterobilharzia americana]|nr:unnamed protein product [Heterobilharzia americana]